MREIPVEASRVRRGDTVTRVVAGGEEQGIDKVRGRWPKVLKADYQEVDEDGKPSVYLELSDWPGKSFCLRPDDLVTVIT
jgi:hypothetical protein